MLNENRSWHQGLLGTAQLFLLALGLPGLWTALFLLNDRPSLPLGFLLSLLWFACGFEQL